MKKRELLIITGAGQGIGAYLAERLSEEYFIILISKSDNCKRVAEKINNRYPNSADFIKLDFEKQIDPNIFKESINLRLFSNINLIFAAGYVENHSQNIDVLEWRKVFNINVFAHMEIFNYFLPKMKRSHNNNKVIFLAGGGAAGPFDTFPAYSASKTAIVRSVENLSLRYAKYNLSIFAVAPGAIKTKMLSKVLNKTIVGTKTSMLELYAFIRFYMENDTNKLNGKLIHIRDDKVQIQNSVNDDYLTLRRIE